MGDALATKAKGMWKRFGLLNKTKWDKMSQSSLESNVRRLLDVMYNIWGCKIGKQAGKFFVQFIQDITISVTA